MQIKISIREFHTILAALRYWQRGLDEDNDIDHIATNDGDIRALDDLEIDELCERINTGG